MRPLAGRGKRHSGLPLRAFSRAGVLQSRKARRFCQDGRDLEGGPPGRVNAASPGPLGATGRVSSDPMDMKSNPT